MPCSQRFALPGTNISHKQTLVTNISSLSFRIDAYIARHKIKIHEHKPKCERGRSSCDNCAQSMQKTKPNLVSHMRVCSMFAQRKAFSQKYSPKTQLHRPRRCDDCERIYAGHYFTKHWQSVHSEEKAPKAYVCDRCPYASQRHDKLQRHAGRRLCW